MQKSRQWKTLSCQEEKYDNSKFLAYLKFTTMQVICLQDTAFYALVEEVVDKINAKQNIQTDKWISAEEAMGKLRITSNTTLQRLRDEGEIRFTHPMKKVILYCAKSIDEYLEKHAKNTF
jgi:Helix-turn-helix domain